MSPPRIRPRVSPICRAPDGHAAKVAGSRLTSLPSGNPPVPIERGRAAMGIIAFIILGLCAGAIAKAIMPGDDPGGWIITAVIGVVRALWRRSDG